MVAPPQFQQARQLEPTIKRRGRYGWGPTRPAQISLSAASERRPIFPEWAEIARQASVMGAHADIDALDVDAVGTLKPITEGLAPNTTLILLAALQLAAIGDNGVRGACRGALSIKGVATGFRPSA